MYDIPERVDLEGVGFQQGFEVVHRRFKEFLGESNHDGFGQFEEAPTFSSKVGRYVRDPGNRRQSIRDIELKRS